jgi:hypothetical protein
MLKLNLKTALFCGMLAGAFVPYHAMAVTGANTNETGGNAGATGSAAPGNDANAPKAGTDAMDTSKTGMGPRGTKIAPSTSPGQPKDPAAGGVAAPPKQP